MTLTKERKGEIAYELMKQRIRVHGINFETLREETNDVAKKLGMPFHDLMMFFEALARELVAETFVPDPEGSHNE